MYKIIKDESVIALTESFHFIRKNDNGCLIQASENEAQGIVLAGKLYHLLGSEEFEDAEETVSYIEVDSGEYILEQQNNLDKLIIAVLEG